MRSNVLVLSLLFSILSLLFACQEEGNELTLDAIQGDALAEENAYRVKAFLDIFSFETNNAKAEEANGYYVVSAFANGESLFIRFPDLKKGEYTGAADPGTRIFYSSSEGKNYFSNNDKFTSNALIRILEVDTAAGVFYADFSAILYDVDSEKPSNRANQVNVYGGQINMLPF